MASDSLTQAVAAALQAIPHVEPCGVLRWARTYESLPEVTMESGPEMAAFDGARFDAACTCDREQRLAARVAAAIDAAWDYATEVTTPRLKETRAAALRALTHEAP